MFSHISLTDSNGWFDASKADKFEEGTHFDGSNHISAATGSQWDHEALYRTASGNWVLNHWSQWQGSAETYIQVSDEEAAQWLVCNGHIKHGATPPTTQELINNSEL